MLIEFLKDHGPHRVGAAVDHPHPGVAHELVRRGIARPAVRTSAPLAVGTVGLPLGVAADTTAAEEALAAPPKPKRVTRK